MVRRRYASLKSTNEALAKKIVIKSGDIHQSNRRARSLTSAGTRAIDAVVAFWSELPCDRPHPFIARIPLESQALSRAHGGGRVCRAEYQAANNGPTSGTQGLEGALEGDDTHVHTAYSTR